MRLLVGTSGYAYREWKGEGLFYPPDLPQKQMLRYYAEHFGTVEINNTFYRMPRREMLEQWSEQVPDDFSFVLKASRRITHLGRLKNVGDAVAYLLETASTLGGKLGPLLFQLPPYMRKDMERLHGFLGLLPDGCRAAVEFRNLTWFDDEVYDALRARNVALCTADGEIKGEVPFAATADWGYLRLRGVSYEDGELGSWAARVREQDWSAAWVFFKHEDEATGPRLARRFAEIFDGGSP